MKKLGASILLLLLLAACANFQTKEYSEWMNEGRVRAERGELKWSEYYKACFSRLADTPTRVDGKSFELEYLHKMIAYAQEFESGHIALAEFEEKRRLSQIEKIKAKEAALMPLRRKDESPNVQTTY